jgi:flagellar hook-basal body complex protein FliE
MPLDAINRIGPVDPKDIKRAASAVRRDIPSFRDTFKAFLNDVNEKQNVSNEVQAKFMAGETTDVHQVMAKSEEANVAFNMLLELRNKAMDGYQEILRLRL